MDQTNEETKKKQIRFSIGSYSEKDKRVINKIPRNELFSASDYVSLRKSPTTTDIFKTIHRERSANLNKANLPKYNTLPSPLRVQNSSIEIEENFSGKNGGNNLSSFADIQKPVCPTSFKNNCCVLVKVNESTVKKPFYPPKHYNSRSILPDADLKQPGKVALIVTAYEGEPKTPTRLEFLPQTRLSRSSSKTSSDASSSIDNTDSISSRLQDELVATLKRSNLKSRNDALENGRLHTLENKKPSYLDQCTEDNQFVNGNVKKLTAVLDKKMTFRIKSEHDESVGGVKV